MFRKQIVAVVTACAVSMGLMLASAPAQANNYDPVQFQDEFTSLINAERARMKRAPLVTSDKLYERSKHHVEVDWVAAGGPFHYTSTQINAFMQADQCTGFWAEIYSPAATTPQDLVARYKNSNTHWNALMEPRLRQIGSFSDSAAGNSTRMSQGCAGNAYPSQELGIFHESLGKKHAFSTEGYTAYYTGAQTNTATDPMGNSYTNHQTSSTGENIMGFELPRYNGTYTFKAPAIAGVKTEANGTVTLTDVGTTFNTPETDETNVDLKPLVIPFSAYPYHDRVITTEVSRDKGTTWDSIDSFGTVAIASASGDNGYTGDLTATITPNEYRRGVVLFRFSTADTPWSNGQTSPVLSYNFGGGITTDSVISIVGDKKIDVIPNESPTYNFTATDAGYRTWILYETRNGGSSAVTIGEADADGNMQVSIPVSNLNLGLGDYTYYLELPAAHGQRAVRMEGLVVTIKPLETIFTWGNGQDVEAPFGSDWESEFATANIKVQGNNSPHGQWTIKQSTDGNSPQVVAQGSVDDNGIFQGIEVGLQNAYINAPGLYTFELSYSPATQVYEPKALERSAQINSAPVEFSFSDEWVDSTLDEDVPFTGLVQVYSTAGDPVEIELQESVDGGKTWKKVWSIMAETDSSEYGFSTSRTGFDERQYRMYVYPEYRTLESYSNVVTIKAPVPLPLPTIAGWAGGIFDRDEGIVETIPVTVSQPGLFQSYDFGTGVWSTVKELPIGTTQVEIVSARADTRIDYRVFIPAVQDETRPLESEHITIFGSAPAVVPEVTSLSLYLGSAYSFTADLPRDGVLQVEVDGQWVDVEDVVDGQRVTINAAKKPETHSYRFFVPGSRDRIAVESPVFTVDTILIETIVPTPQNAGLTHGEKYVFTVDLPRAGVLQKQTSTGWVDQYVLTDGQTVTINALEETGTETYRIFIAETATHQTGISASFTVETNVKHTPVETPRSETIKIKESYTFTVELPRDGMLLRLVDGAMVEVTALTDGQEVTINALDKAGIDTYQIYVPRYNEYLAGESNQFHVWTELYETTVDSTNLTDKTVKAGESVSYTLELPRAGVLQAEVKGRWVDVIAVESNVPFTIVTDRAGVTAYRVFIPASETHESGRSEEFKVTATINQTLVNTPDSKVLVKGDKYSFDTNVDRVSELQVKTNQGWVKSQNILPEVPVVIESNDLLSTLEYRIFVPGTLTHTEATSDVFTVETLDNTIIVGTPQSVTVNAGETTSFVARTVRDGVLQERVDGAWVTVQDVKDGQLVTINAKPTEQSAVYRLFVPAEGFYLEATSGQFTVTTVKQETSLTTPKSVTVVVDEAYTFSPIMDRDGTLESLVDNNWVKVQDVKNGATISLNTDTVGTTTYRIVIAETNTHRGKTSGEFTVTVKLSETTVDTPKAVQRYAGDTHALEITVPREGALQSLVNGEWVTVQDVATGTNTITLEETFEVGLVTYRVFVPETRTHSAGVSDDFIVSTTLRTTKDIANINSVNRFITQSYTFSVALDRDGVLQKHENGKWVTVQDVKNNESVTIEAGAKANSSTYRVMIPATSTHTGVKSNDFTITTTVGVTTVPTPKSVELFVGDSHEFTITTPRDGVVQVETANGWENVQDVKTGDTLTVQAGKKGDVVNYRVMVPASATHEAGVSKTFTVSTILRETLVPTPPSGTMMIGETFEFTAEVPRDGILQADTTGLGWDDVRPVSPGETVVIDGDTAGRYRYRLFVPESETHAKGSSKVVIVQVLLHDTVVNTPANKDLKEGESYSFTVQVPRDGVLQVLTNKEWVDVRNVTNGDKVTIKATPASGTETYRVAVFATSTHKGAVSGSFTVKTTVTEKPGKPDKDKPSKPGKPDKDKPSKPGKPDKDKPNNGKSNNGKGNKDGSKYDGRHDDKTNKGHSDKGNSKGKKDHGKVTSDVDKTQKNNGTSNGKNTAKSILPAKSYTLHNKQAQAAYVQQFVNGKWKNVMYLHKGVKVTITAPSGASDNPFRLYFPLGK